MTLVFKGSPSCYSRSIHNSTVGSGWGHVSQASSSGSSCNPQLPAVRHPDPVISGGTGLSQAKHVQVRGRGGGSACIKKVQQSTSTVQKTTVQVQNQARKQQVTAGGAKSYNGQKGPLLTFEVALPQTRNQHHLGTRIPLAPVRSSFVAHNGRNKIAVEAETCQRASVNGRIPQDNAHGVHQLGTSHWHCQWHGNGTP